MIEFDLVIRNGTVLDGTGAEAIHGDIAISGNKIAAVGKVDGRAAQEIDAAGCLDRASDRLPLPWTIHALTERPAKAVGVNDRYDALKQHRPYIVRDLPNGGRRLTDVPQGYIATILSGKITNRNGAPSAQMPGRLLREPQERAAI